MPNRILAYQSMRMLPFLNHFLVFSIASLCSGRKSTGVFSVDISNRFNAERPSLTAAIPFFTVSRSVLNHSSARCSVSKHFRLIPEFISTWCTCLSLKEQILVPSKYAVHSVYNKSYLIPAVPSCPLIRFLAASFSSLQLGVNLNKSTALLNDDLPIFRAPLCASSGIL